MGKIGSSILTFLLSVPLTAITVMTVFGIPPLNQLNAAPDEEVVVRDPFHDAAPWGEQNSLGTATQFRQPTASRPQLHFDQNSHETSHAQNPFGNPSQPTGYEQASNNAPVWGQQAEASFASGYSHAGHDHYDAAPTNNPFAQHMSNQNQFGQATQQPQQQLAANSNPFGQAPPSSTSQSHGEQTQARQNLSGTGIQLMSWQEASNRLADLGIDQYHLESGARPGTFLFVCLFHPHSSPQVTHRFEAEANDPLVAVNQVISKVNNWMADDYASSTNSSAGSRY